MNFHVAYMELKSSSIADEDKDEAKNSYLWAIISISYGLRVVGIH